MDASGLRLLQGLQELAEAEGAGLFLQGVNGQPLQALDLVFAVTHPRTGWTKSGPDAAGGDGVPRGARALAKHRAGAERVGGS